MSGASELVIGGLRFAIDLPEDLRLEERDPLYLPFMSGVARADREIAVTLTLEDPPDVSGLPVLFDTEATWIAFADGRDVILSWRSAAGPQEPLWVARMSGDPVERVKVHCGPPLVERQAAATTLHNPLHYPLDQLLLMFALPSVDGVLVHAAGLARGGRGVFCAGVSGAGKTTFMSQCGDGCRFLGLSDDRVIVRWMGDEPRLFGTPWAGEGGVAERRDVDLAAVLFLHQSRRHELRRIDARQALDQLLATVSILWFDRLRMERAMNACQRIVESLPCYELHFRPEPAAIDLLDEVL